MVEVGSTNNYYCSLHSKLYYVYRFSRGDCLPRTFSFCEQLGKLWSLSVLFFLNLSASSQMFFQAQTSKRSDLTEKSYQCFSICFALKTEQWNPTTISESKV